MPPSNNNSIPEVNQAVLVELNTTRDFLIKTKGLLSQSDNQQTQIDIKAYLLLINQKTERLNEKEPHSKEKKAVKEALLKEHNLCGAILAKTNGFLSRGNYQQAQIETNSFLKNLSKRISVLEELTPKKKTKPKAKEKGKAGFNLSFLNFFRD